MKLPTYSRSWMADRFLFFDFQPLTVQRFPKLRYVFLGRANVITVYSDKSRSARGSPETAISPLSTIISHRDLPAARALVFNPPGINPIVGDNSRKENGTRPRNPDPNPGAYREWSGRFSLKQPDNMVLP